MQSIQIIIITITTTTTTSCPKANCAVNYMHWFRYLMVCVPFQILFSFHWPIGPLCCQLVTIYIKFQISYIIIFTNQWILLLNPDTENYTYLLYICQCFCLGLVYYWTLEILTIGWLKSIQCPQLQHDCVYVNHFLLCDGWLIPDNQADNYLQERDEYSLLRAVISSNHSAITGFNQEQAFREFLVSPALISNLNVHKKCTTFPC